MKKKEKLKDRIKALFAEYSFRHYDYYLLILCIAVGIAGVFAVGSADSSYMDRQRFGLIIGVFAMIVISFISYSFILKFYIPIYMVTVGILILVKLFGDKGGTGEGATRWFEFGGIRFQPSELAKIAIILFFAQFIMKHHENLNTLKNLLLCVVFILPVFILIFIQPDLSTSIMILVIFASVMFIGGLSYKIVLSAIAVIIPVVIMGTNYIIRDDVDILGIYQKGRILAWLHPEQYADDKAWQTLNAITAIGSGQLYGKGLNNNVIASVKNGNFIAEAQTDMIFAVVGEETGFIGCCIVLGLILLIVIECIRVALFAKDLAGSIIAGSVGALIGFQTFINIGVVTGLLPNTGLPLPFISYGLTSLVSLMMGLGVVMNVRLQTPK